MRILPSVLLVISFAFAYQVTDPGGSQGWNTTGPNYLKWDRVDTDPLNFTAVLTNMNTNDNQVMNPVVDGTLGVVVCNPPTGGWPTGSAYRVNLARDAKDLDSLLAQSSEFNITSVSSPTSASSASIQTTASTASTTTQSSPGVSSSDTSTSPTGTSTASRTTDARAGLLIAVIASSTIMSMFF